MIPDATIAEAPIPAPASTLKQRVVSGAGWAFLDNAAQQLLSLIVFVILGRLLAPAMFGIVSTALIFVLLMRSTVLNSIVTGLIVLPDPVDEDYDTGFWLCVMIAATSIVILMLVAAPLARLYGIPQFADVIRGTGIVVLFYGLSYAHGAWARRNFQFRALAMRSTISTLVAGGVAIAAAMAGYGLTALVLNQVISALLALLLLWRAIPWRPRMRFSRVRARAIMATALPLGATQSLQFIAQNFDTALVTYLLGPIGGGLYAAAKRIVLAVQVAVQQPLLSVGLPAFAEVSGDPIRFGNAAVRMAALVMAVTAPLFAGIALTAPIAVQVLFGLKWAGAAPIMAVLAGFGVFVPSLSLLNQMMMASGKAKVILLLTLIQMALSLLAIALVAGRDPVLIALCLTVPIPIMIALRLAVLKGATNFPLRRYMWGIGRPLACAAIMSVAVWNVPDLRAGPVVQLLVLAGVGSAVYCAATLLIARDTVTEMRGAVRQIRGRR